MGEGKKKEGTRGLGQLAQYFFEHKQRDLGGPLMGG